MQIASTDSLFAHLACRDADLLHLISCLEHVSGVTYRDGQPERASSLETLAALLYAARDGIKRSARQEAVQAAQTGGR